MCTTSGLIRRGSVATLEEITQGLPISVNPVSGAATGDPALFKEFTSCYAR
jgi:hypothetical protein